MIKAVAIATSTGGPAALQQVIPRLPANFPAAVFIVQHMPAGFTKGLADRLNDSSALEVREAVDGDVARAGLVLVAPAGRQMWVTRRRDEVEVRVNVQGPLPSLYRPSADVLFKSVAEVYGAAALAVVLTGMGKDGLVGLRAVKEHGGAVLAQDEATSVVFGMPRAAIEAGLVDAVLPLQEIAKAISARVLKPEHG